MSWLIKIFAERWSAIDQPVRDSAERFQATGDDIPPELALRTNPNLQSWFARHAEALADHTLA